MLTTSAIAIAINKDQQGKRIWIIWTTSPPSAF